MIIRFPNARSGRQAEPQLVSSGIAVRLLLALSLMVHGLFSPAHSLAQQAEEPAERRIALVVGNGAYTGVEALPNPAQDARLIAERLEDAGFEVATVLDTDLPGFKRAVSKFGKDLRSAGSDATGLFYYAGHAVQSFETNYLLPVDTELSDAADLDLVGLEANAVLRQMRSARNRTNIVILDSCRANPFGEVKELEGNGLAEMDAPIGTFLAYATAPGEVALDGRGENSPFSTALAERLLTPGVAVEEMFRWVRIDVRKATDGFQTPWDTSSMTRRFMFVPEEEVVVASPEQRLWESVEKGRDALQIALFLKTYPDGEFASRARTLLADVAAGRPDRPIAVPETVEPTGDEATMLEAARMSGERDDYEAYLMAYPEGVFAELARLEMAALDDAGEPDGEVAAVPAPAEPKVEGVVFDHPLAGDLAEIGGRSISQLIAGSPVFPPVEGLPEEYWKGQSCANCHAWEKANLCTQAKTYMEASRSRALTKQHPYGGAFKSSLRSWAEGGCR